MAKTILLVDDSASIRHVVGIALRGNGYEVLEASDGQEALRRLEGQKVHLIISDVNMPGMNGLDFLREVKKSSAHKFTPFILLTTEVREDKKVEAQMAGAKAWVTKPFQPAQMLEVVRKLVIA